MKLTEMDLPAPVGHGEIAGWIPMPELFPMQSRRQSMGTIKGVPDNDGDDTKSFSAVNNDWLSNAAIKLFPCNFTRGMMLLKLDSKTSAVKSTVNAYLRKAEGP